MSNTNTTSNTTSITSDYGTNLMHYIRNKRPSLTDAQSRIDYGVMAGRFSIGEAEQLTALARDGAPLLEGDAVIRALNDKINLVIQAQRAQGEIIARLVAVANANADDNADDIPAPTPPPEGVTDWYPPTGAHDAYDVGDRVRHAGGIYISLIAANTTVPGSDPRWWSVLQAAE
jgi:hypothetical protein